MLSNDKLHTLTCLIGSPTRVQDNIWETIYPDYIKPNQSLTVRIPKLRSALTDSGALFNISGVKNANKIIVIESIVPLSERPKVTDQRKGIDAVLKVDSPKFGVSLSTTIQLPRGYKTDLPYMTKHEVLDNIRVYMDAHVYHFIHGLYKTDLQMTITIK